MMEQHGEPIEELIEVPPFKDQPEKTYKIKESLTGELRTELVYFLREYKDIFA